MMPTLLDVAGAEYPKSFKDNSIIPLEGISLLPTLREGKTFTRPPLAWEWSGSRAVRINDDKLVWNKTNKSWELYDLKNDPSEVTNLSTEHPQKAETLAAFWFEWAEKTGLKVRKKK